MTRPQRQRGFTLIESLLALLLVMMALLLGHRFAIELPRTVNRLQAGNEAMRAIDSALETLRAGSIPLEDGVLAPPVAYPLPGSSTKDMALFLDVEPTATVGLYEVTVEARYIVGQSILRRRVQTLAWR